MTQLIVTISDKAMSPRLITAIRQLRGVVEVKCVRVEDANESIRKTSGKLHQELMERLQALSDLEDGWDGKGSKAIDRSCITRLEDALNQATEQQLYGWTLFPDARGYLYFEYTGENMTAGITMTGNSLIYFVQKDDVLEKNDGILFSIANFISILQFVATS